MKLKTKWTMVAAACILSTLPLVAGKPKQPVAGPSTVDEGTFNVFVNGARVASEVFSIKKQGDTNVTKSELRLGDGKPAQTAEMSLMGDGSLQKYEWKELEAPKGQNTVEPQNGFLIEHFSTPDGKIGDQPFLMPSTTTILDDFFFSHRQLLMWRYLGSSCVAQQQPPNAKGCELSKTQFGVVVPRQRISSMVSIEYTGPDQITLKGQQRILSKFKMSTEGPDWFLWLDENYKLQKVTIPETNTEVVRE